MTCTRLLRMLILSQTVVAHGLTCSHVAGATPLCKPLELASWHLYEYVTCSREAAVHQQHQQRVQCIMPSFCLMANPAQPGLLCI